MLSENEIETKVNFLSSARCNHTFHKYIDITGDLIEGTLLSRILYWFAPSKDNKSKVKIYKDGEYWIAKQRKDWWEEIRITERQYDKAIKSLVKKKFVITAKYKFNSMPTIHIRPNYDVINAEVKKWEENIRQEVIAEDRGQVIVSTLTFQLATNRSRCQDFHFRSLRHIQSLVCQQEYQPHFHVVNHHLQLLHTRFHLQQVHAHLDVCPEY